MVDVYYRGLYGRNHKFEDHHHSSIPHCDAVIVSAPELAPALAVVAASIR